MYILLPRFTTSTVVVRVRRLAGVTDTNILRARKVLEEKIVGRLQTSGRDSQPEREGGKLRLTMSERELPKCYFCIYVA